MGSAVKVTLADRSHDAGIRQLLRESAMDGGDIALSSQCEPSYFDAASIDGDEHQTIVAIEDDRIVCMGTLSIRQRYFNGQCVRVGYLGRLRLARSHAGRFDILRRGYRLLDEARKTTDLQACFTSIASDNERANRFLQRNVRGLPRYRPAGELVTLLIRRSRCRAKRQSRPAPPDDADGSALPSLVDQYSAHFQFAPRWTEATLRASVGLESGVLRKVSNGCAAAALWDQRAARQIVVERYSRRLRIIRPIYNAASALFNRSISLPPVGRVLPMAFLSHLAAPPDDAGAMVRLIEAFETPMRSAGVEVLAVGFDARDSRLPAIQRRFRPFLYRTRLYTVHWPDGPVGETDGRLIYPEIALL